MVPMPSRYCTIMCHFIRPGIAQYKVPKIKKRSFGVLIFRNYLKIDKNCNLDEIQVFCEDVVLLWIETQRCAISLCLAHCQVNIALKVFFLKCQSPRKYYSFLLYSQTYQNKMSRSGKGRVESSDDEGSFNDAASMVSDVSEVCGQYLLLVCHSTCCCRAP